MPSKHLIRVSSQLRDLRPGERYRFWFADGQGPGLVLEPLTAGGAAYFNKAIAAMEGRFSGARTGAVLVDEDGRPLFVAPGADVDLLRALAVWVLQHRDEEPSVALLACAGVVHRSVDLSSDAAIQALDPAALPVVREDAAWAGVLDWSVADLAAALDEAPPGAALNFWWSGAAAVPLVVQQVAVDPQQLRARALVERTIGASWATGWRGALEVGWDGRLRFEVRGGRPAIWSEDALDDYRPDEVATRVSAVLGDSISPELVLRQLSDASTIATLAGSGEVGDPDPGYGLVGAELPSLEGLVALRISLDLAADVLRFHDGDRLLGEVACNPAELARLREALDEVVDPTATLFDADTVARAAALEDPEDLELAVLAPEHNAAALSAMRTLGKTLATEVAQTRERAEILAGLGDPSTVRVRVFERAGDLVLGLTREGHLLWSKVFLVGWRMRVAMVPGAADGAGEAEILRGMATWAQQAVVEHPGLARLAGAAFVRRDADGEVAETVEDPTLWAGFAGRPAVGSVEASAALLRALEPEASVWMWLTEADRDSGAYVALMPHLEGEAPDALKERLRPLEGRAAVRGQRWIGVLRRLSTGGLMLFTEAEPAAVSAALIAAAERWGGAIPALAELDLVSVAQIKDGELGGSAVASHSAAHDRRLKALVAAQNALLQGLDAEARPYFWLSASADGGAPLLLLDADSKALSATLRGLKGLIGAAGAEAPSVQGRARLMPDQPAVFVAKTAFPDFDSALAAWISAHSDAAPALTRLSGARLHVKA